MLPLYSIYLIFELVASCHSSPTVESALDLVTQECNHKLSQISSIKQFENFMTKYKSLIHEAKVEPNDKSLKKCWQLKDALFDLEQLVAQRGEEVCSMNYVEKLIDYHYKYLTDSKSDHKMDSMERLPANSSYVSYFFSLYAHQVAFTCKSSIAKRLAEAEENEGCLDIVSSFLPEGERGSSQEVEELSKVFTKVESFAPVLKTGNSKSTVPYIDVLVSDEVIERLDMLKSACRARRPYYNAILSPVASLAQLGYTVPDLPQDLRDEASQANLKCWVISSQLCEGILTTHFTQKSDLDPDSDLKSKFVTVKWGTLSDIDSDAQVVHYHDELSEISPAIVTIVKKRFSPFGKIKQKIVNWTQKLMERYVNIEALRKSSNEGLVKALMDDSNGVDGKVAFNGKQYDTRQFNPASVILNEADTAVQMTSSFWNKLGLLFSSVVAVVMSAVFIYFSIVAIATTIQQAARPSLEGSIKTEWNQLRDKRVKNVEEKFNKLSYRMFHVQRPN